MSKQAKKRAIDSEVYYGTVPLGKEDKIYGFWDIFLITGGWAIATWAYVQGGQIATMIGLEEAVTNTFFGMTLAGLFLCLCVLITTRYGIDIWMYQKALFGYFGLVIFAVIILASQLGYDVINAEVYASSMMKVFAEFGITIPEYLTPYIATTCVIFGAWIALRGPIAVRTATRIMVPCLMALGVFIIITVFRNFSLQELLNVEPLYEAEYGSGLANYMVVLEWNIAFIFAWFASIGVLSRLVKTERSAYWGHVGGFSIVMATFTVIGVLTALAMLLATGVESVDPTDWLLELGGPVLGLLAILFVAVANVTTVAVSLYGISISTKVLKPELSFSKVVIFWSAWVVILLFWGGIWEYYSVFLALVGATSGSVVALIVVDFFIVRRQKISMKDLYRIGGRNAYRYTGGFNLMAILSFIAGVIGYLWVYEPIEAVPRNDIFLYTTATGFSMIISGLTYLLLSMIKPFNDYLRKDKKRGE
ncbi:cytosine permease [Salicibibacter cibarius]|uniref:Cytosine permease n=1 Tax=Salicibibacter cibarius TaxID=2743000 RepID=A0A7T7CC04_9BACI|nr:cytosine permease [Salicibibacter cibarius]QQK76499.1 cytosine permease [Salicibibacter cibarius]